MQERGPTVDQKGLLRIIQGAFAKACLEDSKARPEPSPRKRNARRARLWVKTLADEFRSQYAPEKDIRVFSRDDFSHRKEFGLNELLWDLTICRVGTINAPVHKKKELSYPSVALWAIESEFARNTRSAIVDFSKLVLSSALNKLFVGPFVGPQDGYRSALAAPAQACGGVVYMGHVSHPDKWDNEAPRVPSLYLWHEHSWKPIRE